MFSEKKTFMGLSVGYSPNLSSGTVNRGILSTKNTSTLLQSDNNADKKKLEEALRLLEAEAINFATRNINDANVRVQYINDTKQLTKDLLLKVEKGLISASKAAEEANLIRNEIMNIARLKTSDIGKAKASNLKSIGRSLDELCQHYAQQLYKADFVKLTKYQQDSVFLEIVKSAGRSNSSVNLRMSRLSRLGRGLLVLSICVSVYNVATAEDKVKAVEKEGAVLGGGIVGGAAGGALAGLACGPGAPFCVTVGVFVGGILGALGVDVAFDNLF